MHLAPRLLSLQASYPLSKKKHTLEYLREILHLRPRTNTIGAVARIRNACAFATHKFFQVRDYCDKFFLLLRMRLPSFFLSPWSSTLAS